MKRGVPTVLPTVLEINNLRGGGFVFLLFDEVWGGTAGTALFIPAEHGTKKKSVPAVPRSFRGTKKPSPLILRSQKFQKVVSVCRYLSVFVILKTCQSCDIVILPETNGQGSCLHAGAFCFAFAAKRRKGKTLEHSNTRTLDGG